MQDIDDRHDAGLGLRAVGGQEFLRRFQGGFGDFQVFIGEDDFPIGLLYRGQDGEDTIAKDVFFHGGIILCDADECLGDVDAGVAEERLREGERKATGIGWIEQERSETATSGGSRRLAKAPLSSGDIISSGAIVQVDVAACRQIRRGIERDRVVPLIENPNVIEWSL